MAPQQSLSPEAVEAAARGYNAGLRALAYGSVLGLGAVRLATATHTVCYYGVCFAEQTYRSKRLTACAARLLL